MKFYNKIFFQTILLFSSLNFFGQKSSTFKLYQKTFVLFIDSVDILTKKHNLTKGKDNQILVIAPDSISKFLPTVVKTKKIKYVNTERLCKEKYKLDDYIIIQIVPQKLNDQILLTIDFRTYSKNPCYIDRCCGQSYFYKLISGQNKLVKYEFDFYL